MNQYENAHIISYNTPICHLFRTIPNRWFPLADLSLEKKSSSKNFPHCSGFNFAHGSWKEYSGYCRWKGLPYIRHRLECFLCLTFMYSIEKHSITVFSHIKNSILWRRWRMMKKEEGLLTRDIEQLEHEVTVVSKPLLRMLSVDLWRDNGWLKSKEGDTVLTFSRVVIHSLSDINWSWSASAILHNPSQSAARAWRAKSHWTDSAP